jgi:SAM-dependent methyltransferase
MFSLGDAYHVFMGRWSGRLAPLLVQFAGVTDGDDVLDVGSGTGSLAGAVAVVGPSTCIAGIDRSEPYVAVARARHQSPRTRFEVGGAQQLPFEDASFDQTLSQLILKSHCVHAPGRFEESCRRAATRDRNRIRMRNSPGAGGSESSAAGLVA